MADSVSKIMVSIVDSQVKNKDNAIASKYSGGEIKLTNKHVYTRNQLIDDGKESALVQNALHIAFEDSIGWNLNKQNPNIQNKVCADTRRKVFRIICREIRWCSFMDIYDYLECGYHGVADFDIVHHIDNDHDILYQKIESPTAEWLLSSRDCQCVRMRFFYPKYHAANTNKIYVVMGTLWYPLDESWKDHILYIDPDKYYRIGFKYGARVYYKPLNATDDIFTYIGLQHSYRSNGWVPYFIEDAFGLKQKNIQYFRDLCKRIPQELKQRKLNMNPKVQEPLLQCVEEQKDDKEEIEDEQDKVRIWLKGDRINMEQYYDILINNGFENFDLIRRLTLDIMEQIGIAKIGHRIELMRRINNLEGNVIEEEYITDDEGQATQFL